MPQYPIPPWPEWVLPPRGYVRQTRLSVNHRRYAHLPLVAADADGNVTVLRGDPALAEDLADSKQVAELIKDKTVLDVPHFVVRNRLGRTFLMAATGMVAVGQIELRLWSHGYKPSAALAAAGSIEEMKAALDAERCRLLELEADGWELIVHQGVQLLVDTTRPDECLTARDLP